MTSLIRRCLLAVAVALATLAVPAPAQAASYAASSNPILFVHGWNSSASTWNTMISRFQANGWPSSHLRAFSYNTSQSNATTAATIRQEVDNLLAATGAAQVDIVTHSMGGLSSRYYLKNIAASNVDRWVSLGGPNHGTSSANTCFSTACVEMRVGSTFLANLNAGDETPGTPTYGTWWSSCDGVINPADSTVLSGARNTRTACIGHLSLTTDATVYAQVRDFVNP
ncbi:triacylglycerol lipase [Micromonospora phytophila]|uniref:esterase/lipase family protein n=1 Tax=Micromonospora phytophila TaxID=709888 RepID=UPI00202DE694|nr:triacylglycerol lipase [Micromonospora phytophila]MCM0677955.1 triacylglycerol lipase [Micromonospora phytophila]